MAIESGASCRYPHQLEHGATYYTDSSLLFLLLSLLPTLPSTGLTLRHRSKVDGARGGDAREGRLRRSLRLSGWAQVRDAVASGDGYDDDALGQGLPGNVPLDVLARLPDHRAQQRPTPATQSVLKATAAPREVASKSSSMVPRVRHPAGL